jgi:hypothetical protein
MGIGALRATIQHPGLELAGLVVHSEAKEGRDAGDLCGLPPTGVIATRDIDRALAIDADVVAYFASSDYRYREAADDIARCLRAGRDVVTTSLVSFCWPPAAEPDLRELLEAACAAGGATLFNSGVEPGWINDLVPFAFSSTCARIDRITMQEILDYSPIAQPDIMYDFMGFAHPPDTVMPLQEPGRLNRLWAPVVWGLAAGLGLTSRTRPRRDRCPPAPWAGCASAWSGSPPARSGSCWSTSPAWASTAAPTGRVTPPRSAATG